MSQSIGTLYTYTGQSTGLKVLATAAAADLKIDVAPNYTHKETNRTPEFLAKFPVGKVPAFEGKDGTLLVESNAIAKYIALKSPNSGLLGSSPEEAAQVDQWILFSELELGQHGGQIIRMVYGYAPYFKPGETKSRETLAEALTKLDNILLSRTFIVGHRLTLADIILAGYLRAGFGSILGADERAKIPNVVRYVHTICNQPKVKDVLGEIKLADKSIQYTPPAKPVKEKAPPAPPKEKAAPKAAAEDDEEEDAAPAEPKAKNPLDLLPKSTLNLEDWKRAYSNLDTRGAGGSLEWFYEKNDPEGYSLWKVEFKYPEELTQVFMSSNLIGGFFNRLEASRKYLFGSLGVLGESNNSLIQGAFIARGQDIKAVVDCAPDWESYNYERIDLANAEQKAFFEAALAWDLEVDGKKWADGKNFK